MQNGNILITQGVATEIEASLFAVRVLETWNQFFKKHYLPYFGFSTNKKI